MVNHTIIYWLCLIGTLPQKNIKTLLASIWFETHFLYVLFDPDVGWLNYVSCKLNVSMHDQRLVRPVRVDAHLAGVYNRLWCGASLPAQFCVALELAWIRSLW